MIDYIGHVLKGKKIDVWQLYGVAQNWGTPIHSKFYRKMMLYNVIYIYIYIDDWSRRIHQRLKISLDSDCHDLGSMLSLTYLTTPFQMG